MERDNRWGKLPAAAQDNVDTKELLSEKVNRLVRITHRQVGSTHAGKLIQKYTD